MLGPKGLQIEQHAHEVMACAQLQKDSGRFKEDFELVGTHLGRAQNKFLDSEKRLGKFESKLEQAVDSEPELSRRDARASRAVDAPSGERSARGSDFRRRGEQRVPPAQRYPGVRSSTRSARGRRCPRRARCPGAPDGPDRPAVREVSGARPGRGRRRVAPIWVPSSGQAPPSILTRPQAGHCQASSVDAFLEEQQLDAAVGGRLERPAPAGSSAGVATGLLLPRARRPWSPAPAPRLEQRLGPASTSCAGRVRVGARPADDRLARTSCESSLSSSDLRLLGGDDDRLRPAQPADLPVDLLGDLLQVVVDELLDVPLVATATSRPGHGGRGVVVLLDDLLGAGPRAGGRGRRARGRRRSTSAPSPRPTSGRAARGRGCG